MPGRLTIWKIVGQGPTALAVGAGGGCLDIFTLSILSLLCLPLFGRRLDRLKYCLRGPLNPKQPTNLEAVLIFTYPFNEVKDIASVFGLSQ